MMPDVLLNKKASIERCVQQIQRYYSGSQNFTEDYLRQDAISANIQRIADLCIDSANYVIKKKKLGLPKNSADSFVLLNAAGLISHDMLQSLRAMVGFRNVIVHQYTELDINLMIDVIENHLAMPIDFAQALLLAMMASDC